MTKSIKIRKVPPSIHRTLKSRAALTGMSLSEYLLAELERLAALPTQSELKRRFEMEDAVNLSESSAAIIRKDRAAT